MFNASVRPSVRPSVCLKPKFGQLFDLSCLNLRGSAERTCSCSTPRSSSSMGIRKVVIVDHARNGHHGHRSIIMGAEIHVENPSRVFTFQNLERLE